MERWGFLFSAVNSPIVYFLTTMRVVCLNSNPIMFAHTFVTSTMLRAICILDTFLQSSSSYLPVCVFQQVLKGFTCKLIKFSS